LEGTTGNIESKVRSAAEVRMRFFGATFFLEVEVEAEVISVVCGLHQPSAKVGPEVLTDSVDSRGTWFLVLRVTRLVNVRRCLLSLSE
jgi:hypothetical protein